MVTVTMVETQLGSPDGIAVQTYEAGQSYEIPGSLADVFVTEGWAKKSAGRAPENKSEGPPPENKSEPKPARKRAGKPAAKKAAAKGPRKRRLGRSSS